MGFVIMGVIGYIVKLSMHFSSVRSRDSYANDTPSTYTREQHISGRSIECASEKAVVEQEGSWSVRYSNIALLVHDKSWRFIIP
jgi:hypothetical protein